MKREFIDEEGNQISRKRMKKLRRVARRPNQTSQTPKIRRASILCAECPNPKVNYY